MTPGFTPEQQRAIGTYFRAVADTMGLRDWRFELMFEPPPNPQALAMIAPTYGRKVASVWFCRHFAELSPEDQRHTITHELTHVITDSMTVTLENIGQKIMGAPAFAALWEATRERTELATDQIADTLAPFLPLIDWAEMGDEELERVGWSDKPAEPTHPEAPLGYGLD